MKLKSLIATGLLSMLASHATHAQSDYPVNRVTLVTHYSPGGGTDVDADRRADAG